MARQKMPVLFVGHGSPMNAVEDNSFTRGWAEIARTIPRPEAILSVSAHWYTEGTRINDALHPETVYDMYGFSDELYRVRYDAPGSPELAGRTRGLISRNVRADNSWGIDHGTWSVLCRMYPQADIPVVQLSIDRRASMEELFQIGREIGVLRAEGVLLFASGNVVHNLARIDWNRSEGYPWASRFDAYIRDRVTGRRFQEVLNYKSAGEPADLAFFTPEHFDPLVYALGASEPEDRIAVYNEACTLGSISMTCYLFDSGH